ncbi:MAG: tRNA 2-selenouridine(34) synthase MnmH, partial [Ramlibacter sp.]|nr:tRNA 2-selenouridine(34) synthase MnmH [Ramlibacter sp.]
FMHYDPGYAASIARNFKQFGSAVAIAPQDRSPAAFAALADAIRAGEDAAL